MNDALISDWLELVGTSALRTAALGLLAGALLRLLGIRGPAAVHRTWVVVLAAGLAMPWLPGLVPNIRLGARSVPAGTDALRIDPSVSPPIASRESTSAVPPQLQSAPRAPTAASTTARPSLRWPPALTTVYLFGSSVLLGRLALGWIGMYTLARSARRLPDEGGRPPTFVSPLVSTPVTTGVLRTRILLPPESSGWPDGWFQAVIGHETAHFRRHDPLIALIARVHSCLFWFSPFAWWLERRIAASAEAAADDTALRESLSADVYLETLLDAARRAGRARGRLALPALNMGGPGGIDRRVERILNGEPWGPARKWRTLVALSGTVGLAGLVAACGFAERYDEPDLEARSRAIMERAREWTGWLEPPPFGGNLLDDEEREAWRREREEHAAMVRAEVRRLRDAIATDPDDLDARTRLLVAHTHALGRTVPANVAEARAEKEESALWMIEHLPEHELLGGAGRLVSDPLHLGPYSTSQATMKRAESLWRDHIADADATAEVLGNAAYFFEYFDPPLAEDLLVRAQALRPDPEWSIRLGTLYALALRGERFLSLRINFPFEGVVIANPFDRSGLQGRRIDGTTDIVYAARVRETLRTTNDALLLATTAAVLLHPVHAETVDPASPGWDYAERALALDPGSVRAKELLVDRGRAIRHAALTRIIRGAWPRSTPREVVRERGPEWEFLYLLDELTHTDLPGMRLRLPRDASTMAEDLLAMAPAFRGNPNYPTALFAANLVLGLQSVDQDPEGAAGHLLAAVSAGGSEEIAYRPGPLWLRLSGELLDAGQGEAVRRFLDRFGALYRVEPLMVQALREDPRLDD
jgi:hypothetical protein